MDDNVGDSVSMQGYYTIGEHCLNAFVNGCNPDYREKKRVGFAMDGECNKCTIKKLK